MRLTPKKVALVSLVLLDLYWSQTSGVPSPLAVFDAVKSAWKISKSIINCTRSGTFSEGITKQAIIDCLYETALKAIVGDVDAINKAVWRILVILEMDNDCSKSTIAIPKDILTGAEKLVSSEPPIDYELPKIEVPKSFLDQEQERANSPKISNKEKAKSFLSSKMNKPKSEPPKKDKETKKGKETKKDKETKKKKETKKDKEKKKK